MLNFNAPNKLHSFSPTGLRFYGNMNFKNKLGIRTNFAANFYSERNTADTRTLIDNFFTEIEF